MLESTGAPVYRLANFDDLDGVMASIRGVGAAVGEEAAAERIVDDMRRRLAAVAARRAGRPQPRVLSYSGGFTAGRGTTFDDMVRRAGGINEAAARGIDKFPHVSEEQVLAWNPDVLVAGYLPGEEDSVRRRLHDGRRRRPDHRGPPQPDRADPDAALPGRVAARRRRGRTAGQQLRRLPGAAMSLSVPRPPFAAVLIALLRPAGR